MADFLSGIFGSKPQIADYTPIDFSEEQLKALEGDLAAWPQIQSLGNLFQTYLLQGYERAIPGFGDILKLGGQTTKDMLTQADQYLHGEIPKDVQAAVERSDAFTSLMGGTAGSGMARALTARDFGLTSMNLIGQGAQLAGQAGNAAQQWANLSGAGASSNIMAGMLITPQQRAQLDMQQNLIKQATQQLRYNVAAAPNPTLKGLSDIVENLTAAYLGGKVGAIGAGNAAATQAAQMPVSDVSTPGYYMGGAGTTGPFQTSGGYQPIGGYGAGSPGSFNDQFALPTGGAGTDQSGIYDWLNASAFQQGAFGGSF